MKLKSIIYFIILVSIGAFADDPYMAADQDHYKELNNTHLGEIFDRRRGDMTFELQLFSIPGPNDLDLDISLSFNKTSSFAGGFYAYMIQGPFGPADYVQYQSINEQFGGWQLEVPRLVGQKSEDLTCNSSGLFANESSLKTPSPMILVPGERPRTLIKNTPNSPFENVDYFTIDGWTAKCKKVIDLARDADYIVRSPKGLIYRFERLPKNASTGDHYPNAPWRKPTALIPNAADDMVFSVKRVEDLSGNWIDYKYDGFRVSKIVASDGRVIDINWQTIATTNPPNQYVKAISSIVANGKTWTFDYTNCGDIYGSICMKDSFVDFTGNGYGINLATLLKSITRPDGKQWQMEYSNYVIPLANEGRSPRAGRHFHVTKLTTPEGMIASYKYRPVCTYFLEGKMETWSTGFFCIPYLLLTNKSYSGNRMEPISWYYGYFVPGYVDRTGPGEFEGLQIGDPVSYSFEAGPTKLKVFKFRRNLSTGYFPWDSSQYSTNFRNRNFIDSGRILESAILPMPTTTYTMPALPSLPPPPPPGVAVTDLQLSYPVGTPFVINFVAGGTMPVVWTTCAIDGGPPSPCGALNSFTVPGSLSQGPHNAVITVIDTFGRKDETQISFWVGEPFDPAAPVLIRDLRDVNGIVGLKYSLSAQYSGTVTKYEWYKDDVLIPGASQSTFSFTFSTDKIGTYKVIAYNGKSKKESSLAKVSLNAAVLIPIFLNLIE